MKKIKLLLLLLSMFSFELNASKIENEAFNQWVEEKTAETQMIGIGYNEEGLGVVYGVNSDFSFYGTDKTNFYTFIEMSNNRIEFLAGYDILRNYGLKGFQIIPEAGFSIDTSSAELGVLGAIKMRYNIKHYVAIEGGYKYFLSKPTEFSGDTDPDKKGYVFTYISYQF